MNATGSVRPCSCDRLQRGKPFVLARDCRPCWLYHHDSRYSLLWGGNGQVIAAVGPPRAERRLLPCRHRGDETRRQLFQREGCTSCAKKADTGRVTLKVFDCPLHQECTPETPLPGVACCKFCPDWTLHEPFDKTPVRDLAYHVYPVKGNGRWQWNVRQLLRRIGLFNGRRAIGIVQDHSTDAAGMVMEAFAGEVDHHDFVIVNNNPGLREVATFEPLFSRMSTSDPARCLCYGHAKGVTHWLSDDDSDTSHDWSETLYQVMLDYWPLVEEQLTAHHLTGAFRQQHRQWPEHSQATWFYSGSWVWYRSRHLFARNWRAIDRFWTGIEPYPAILFDHPESGCLFADQADNVYGRQHWTRRYGPELRAWENEHAHQRIAYG